MSYYFSKKLDLGFEEAIEKVTGALKSEGFGILTEIDVQETLKKKLDVDFRPYKILGACNAPFAYEAFEVEDKIERCILAMLSFSSLKTELKLQLSIRLHP